MCAEGAQQRASKEGRAWYSVQRGAAASGHRRRQASANAGEPRVSAKKDAAIEREEQVVFLSAG